MKRKRKIDNARTYRHMYRHVDRWTYMETMDIDEMAKHDPDEIKSYLKFLGQHLKESVNKRSAGRGTWDFRMYQEYDPVWYKNRFIWEAKKINPAKIPPKRPRGPIGYDSRRKR